MRAALLVLMVLLAGCAQFKQAVQSTKAQMTLVDGLRQYDQGDHETSAKSLSSALGMGLTGKDRADAHKHLAFIHCSANRERQCREEFKLALAAFPALRLDAAEASHPVWGPMFRSMSPGAALATGLKQYEEGLFDESARNLQGAIDLGLPVKDRAAAHKHLAFIHCSVNRERQCRDEFRRALALDPKLDLTAAEAGHPVWGPIFRSLKAGR
jgi:Tfp pilus assembly protein PilF